MADQRGEQGASPSHAAFEEREPQARKAARHATDEKGFRDGVARPAEMADMVVNEIADRVAQAEVRRCRMKGRRIAELFALAPDRIVVVKAVDTEHVEPAGVAATDAELIGLRNCAPDQTAERDRLDADFLTV